MHDKKTGRQWGVPEVKGKEKVKEREEKMAEAEDKKTQNYAGDITEGIGSIKRGECEEGRGTERD